MTLEDFVSRLDGVKKHSNNQYSAKCPAHDDQKASLAVSEDNEKLLLHCHAGCTVDDITKAMGLTMKDLFVTPSAPVGQAKKNSAPVTVTYDYTDLSGRIVAYKDRKPNKEFYWRTAIGKYGRPKPWCYLYNWQNVRNSATVWIVEGEKDVDTLKSIGVGAVTLSDGAKTKWCDEYTDFFKGKNVAIIPDNDEPGKKYADMIYSNVKDIAKKVIMITLSDIWENMPEKADITDYLDQGGDFTKVRELANNSKPYEPKNINSKWDKFKIISAPDLQKADLPPVKFLVNDILPEGTSLIAAPSKIGKSWFVLDMGLSIAAGRSFLTHPTNASGVLYLALEDSENRLQSRMRKILNGTPPPEHFYFMTKAPKLDDEDGLIEMLEYMIKMHPDIKLIIVDTLQKIRGQALRNEASYAQDYREMTLLKDFADKNGVSTFFVHHTRKMKDEDDPFNMISGTNGIMGAADTAFTIVKQKREDTNATLHITGRDVAPINDLVTFNNEVWRWERIGDAAQIAEENERTEFENNPIVKTVRYALETSNNGWWSGTATELFELGMFVNNGNIAENPKDLGHSIKKLIPKLEKRSNIKMEKHKRDNKTIYQFHEEKPIIQSGLNDNDLIEFKEIECG